MSGLKKHKDLKNIHRVQCFEYANAAARTAVTSWVADDIGKVARDLDTNCFWVLVDDTGPTWEELTNKSVPPNLDVKVSVSSNDTTAGFLDDKIVATEGSNTTNILETYQVNDGGDEDLELRIDQAKISITESQISDLTHTVDTFASVAVDGSVVSTAAPTLDFDGTDFDVVESPTDDFDIKVKDSGIDHDQTTNYVANEHIDWTAASAGTIDPTNYVDNDEKVKVSSNETGGSKYLEDQIVAGTNIAINVLNEGGNEQLEVVATGDLTADCPLVQVRRTTDLAFTTSFVDVTFDTTDVESVPGTIEHDNTNTDRIQIKENGFYQIHYHGMTDVDAPGMYSYQVRLNDSVVIPGSETFRDDGGDTFPHSVSFVAECAGGDYLTLQIKKVGGTANFEADIVMTVAKCAGAKGDAGATGAGSNIIVQEDDVTVGTVTSTLNFEGSGVSSVVDEGSNKTTVTITSAAAPVYGTEFDEASSDGTSSTTSSTFQQKLRLTTSSLPSGTYRIGFYCETWQSQIDEVEFQVELNDSDVLNTGIRECEETTDRFSDSGFAYRSISGVNTVDIDWREQGGGTASIRRARIELWRVS